MPRVASAFASAGARRGHVRPEGELAALLVGEIEQRRQHARRELDGHAVDPVEGLADRQALEDLDDPLADQRLEMDQVARRSDRLHHLPMGIVLRPVHGDEPRLQREVGVGIAHHDAARRGEESRGSSPRG